MACDFFVVATATFRFLYAFVIMEIGTRRIVHHNVTAHPSAEWTLQQFREALPGEQGYEYVIHDRDRIYSSELDRAVHEMGVGVLRTPVRAPRANCFCERVVRTIRRECLELHHYPFGEPPSEHAQRVDFTLQPRTQAFPHRWRPFVAKREPSSTS